jgi:hypothetical protein
VLLALKLAAHLNQEIGIGADDRPPGATIIFKSNLQPGRLRRDAHVRRRQRETAN